MSKCYKCPYTTEVTRTFGVTKHCNLAASQIDVAYYCSPKHSDEENTKPTRLIRGRSVGKYL